MIISKVTTQGRVTNPAPLRKKYKLRKGSKMVFAERENKIILQNYDKKYFEKLAGLLKEKGKMLDALYKDKLVEREL